VINPSLALYRILDLNTYTRSLVVQNDDSAPGSPNAFIKTPLRSRTVRHPDQQQRGRRTGAYTFSVDSSATLSSRPVAPIARGVRRGRRRVAKTREALVLLALTAGSVRRRAPVGGRAPRPLRSAQSRSVLHRAGRRPGSVECQDASSSPVLPAVHGWRHRDGHTRFIPVVYLSGLPTTGNTSRGP